MSDIKDYIEQEIKENRVLLFMKGDKQSPLCGFSGVVVHILGLLEVEFKTINVLENEDIRQGIKDYSDWPTIPQLYVNGEFVGGCDIVRELYESGELQKMVK